MAIHPMEEATIRAFVVAARRGRWVALLGNSRRRREGLNALNHFRDWDERVVRPVGSGEDVVAVLRRVGAAGVCWVVSGSRELDGREMGLAEAVGACEAYAFASVLCCVAGRVGFYFGELDGPRRRELLVRGGAP